MITSILINVFALSVNRAALARAAVAWVLLAHPAPFLCRAFSIRKQTAVKVPHVWRVHS